MSEYAVIRWTKPDDVKVGDRVVDNDCFGGVWLMSAAALDGLRSIDDVSRVAVIVADFATTPEEPAL